MEVHLFARIRDQIGHGTVVVESVCTVAELRHLLQLKFPQQKDVFDAGYALVAVNQAVITDEAHVLHEHDEVALLPPMTGG